MLAEERASSLSWRVCSRSSELLFCEMLLFRDLFLRLSFSLAKKTERAVGCRMDVIVDCLF